jgi:hypothetical protein
VKTTEPVKLLWTGGWDSTYRLLDLLLVQGRRVAPAYVIDPERASTLHEIRAMESIRRGVLARLAEPGRLAPTEVHVRTHFAPTPQMAAQHVALGRQVHVGSQYLWLAAVAEAQGWQGAELCMARYETPPALQRHLFDQGGRLRDVEGAELFRFWSFPLLEVSKAEMAERAAERGFLDLLRRRWFCFTPLGNRPCGACRPCRLAHREDVRFANPLAVRARDGLRAVRRRGVAGTAARAASRALGRAPASQ